jgi:hypothetical protein
VSARGQAILDRFPLHVGARDPGKRFGIVVDGLVAGGEVLTRQVGDVRRAHRVGESPTVGDLLGLAAMHGLRDEALVPIGVRLAAVAAAVAADPDDVASLAPLLNLPVQVLDGLGDEARSAALAALTGHAGALAAARGAVLAVVAAAVGGNGTSAALLHASAAYLGLQVHEVTHTGDRWWHLARCRDRLRLAPDLQPADDVLAVEENPFRTADVEPAPRHHAQRFRLLRGGLEDVAAGVLVVGIGTRTVRPMVVSLDEGRGLVFEGDVPGGAELVFQASGRAVLGGSDVTGSAWEFAGAVFASATEQLTAQDFRFADAAAPVAEPPPGDRTARFVVTAPLADALDEGAAFPHGAAGAGPLRLPLGESRWACFVRLAHAGTGPDEPAVPRTAAGRFDAAVFGDATAVAVAPGLGTGEPSLALGFVWEEREPFAVRVLLPRRLSGLDDDAGTRLREPLRRLLDRHRAAGVDLRVEYADPRWTLGVGVVRDDVDDAIGTVLAGTELWPDPADADAPFVPQPA